jgi:predicted ATPase
LAARRGDTTTDASARSGDLARLLALSFPPPHADPAVTTPFWITSLETAATADIAAVRAAFAAALHHAAAPGGEAEPIRPPPRGP